MNTKLYDSEFKVMEVLWKEGDDSAKHISEILNAEIGWNKNTTYTVIKKCVAKGAIERYGSNYMCKPLISKENVEEFETKELIDKLFHGSKINFFASFVSHEKLSEEERRQIKKMLEK